MKVAIVHYWLVGMRGGERVLEALCRIYPDADIITHVYVPEAVSETIRRHRVRTTFIQRLPYARRLYNHYLPLMPFALEQVDLRAYDLVISSESGPSKGVITEPDALHICYCHSPMRYLWDQYFRYIEHRSWLAKVAMQVTFHYLRIWDVSSSSRVEGFIANSAYVAQRIEQYWNRDSEIIHPPVDTARFQVSDQHEGYYLWVGKIVRYKAPDVAVAAFNQSGRTLLVIGEGEMQAELAKKSRPNIRYLGNLDDEAVAQYLQSCRALIFPGAEDFGIVPLEAMACGKPVIAYNRGGAAETVVDGVSGILFDDPSPEGLNRALDRFESPGCTFDSRKIRSRAEEFSEDRFSREFLLFVERTRERKFRRHRERIGLGKPLLEDHEPAVR